MRMSSGSPAISRASQALSIARPNPKTVLIAGGAGFLGSSLCEHYLENGDRVICLDNLSTGRFTNIHHLLPHKNFKLVTHDVTQPYSPPGPIDLIYNMACPASPPKYQIDPIHTFKTNVFGACHLLDLARKKGARILQASTSEVYGDPLVSPQREDYHGNVNIQGPRSCYDEGKRAAETLFHDYHAQFGVEVKIARIFNTYGPRMDPGDGRVVSNFIVQALRGDEITVNGDGSQTRSFCYLDDLVDGLVKLMHSPADLVQPVNIGNPGEFTVLELAKIVLDMTGSSSTLSFRDLPQDDPRQRRPDISTAKTLLGWSPQCDLAGGLSRTIPYFAAELSKINAVTASAGQ